MAFSWEAAIAAATGIAAVLGAAFELFRRIRNEVRHAEEHVVGVQERLAAQQLRIQERMAGLEEGLVKLREAEREERRDAWTQHRSMYEVRITATREAFVRERDGERKAVLDERHRSAQNEYLDLLDRAVLNPELIDPGIADRPGYRALLVLRIGDVASRGRVARTEGLTHQEEERLGGMLQQLESLPEEGKTAEERISRGNAYLRLKQYSKAVMEYNQVLEENPNHQTALFNRAHSLAELGKQQEALKDFTRLLQLHPNDPEALKWRGRTSYTPEDALVDYNDAVSINPNDLEARKLRGRTLDNLGKHQEALADFDQAVHLNPSDVDALKLRGGTLDELDQHQEALSALSQAVNLAPDDAEARKLRGGVLDELDQYEDALADFNRAVELRPNDPETRKLRGSTLDELGRDKEALADFNRAVELRPDDPDALKLRGSAFDGLELREEALTDLSKALDLRPDDLETRYRRARIRALEDESDEALEDLRRAVEAEAQYRERARSDPGFAPIRDDPRFRELVGEDEPPAEDSPGS